MSSCGPEPFQPAFPHCSFAVRFLVLLLLFTCCLLLLLLLFLLSLTAVPLRNDATERPTHRSSSSTYDNVSPRFAIVQPAAVRLADRTRGMPRIFCLCTACLARSIHGSTFGNSALNMNFPSLGRQSLSLSRSLSRARALSFREENPTRY